MIKIQASFDDGSAYDVRMADLMNKYKIPTTFYIPVNYKKYLTKKGIPPLSDDQLLDIANEFEIGSHGVNHELLTRVNDVCQDNEIYDSKAIFEDLFARKITKFCYARGYYDDDIKAKVKDAGYKSARTVKVGNLSPYGDKFQRPVTVHIGYDRDDYGDLDWLTYAHLKMIDAVELSNNGKQVEYSFFGHSFECEKLSQWDRVEEFLKLLKEYLL